MAGVILDALAEAHLFHHFEVVVGAHFEALCFDEFACFFEGGHLFGALLFDVVHRLLHGVAVGDELLGREEGVGLDAVDDCASQGVDGGDAFDFVTEELDADGGFVEVGGMNFDDIAANSELTAAKSDVVALEEEVDQFFQEFVTSDFLADPDGEHGVFVVIGTSQTIDAGNGGHDDDVLAGEDRTHGREAHTLDLVVDGGVFLDVGVGARDVGFGLVVVEVGDEVFDRVGGEEVFELGVELSREGLVVRHDQGRLADVPDHVGHREGLARAGDPEEGLVLVAGFDGLGELGNSLRLIAGGLVVTGKFEGHGENVQHPRPDVQY